MANKFTQKAQSALRRSLDVASELGHSYIGSEHLLLGLAAESDGTASRLLSERGATYDKIRKLVIGITGSGNRCPVSSSDMTPRVKKIIELSATEAQKGGQTFIGTEHMLLALIDERDCVGVKVLESIPVSIAELSTDIQNFISSCKERTSGVRNTRERRDERKEHNISTLSAFSRNLTNAAKAGKLDPIIGRDSETQRLIQILSRRTKNNPCLTGEPGVGKTAVVEGLAQRIADGNVPDNLKDKKIITLDIPAMIAGAKYRGEFEERMKNVMSDVAKDPSIILFIDEIHTLIGAGAAEGAVDAANIIKPALARGEMQLIGATTISEYRKHIEKDAALERRFQPVNVSEPSESEAIKILLGLRDKYEAHHGLKIDDSAIYAAVQLSSRYITDRFLPDKAIDLLDEAASKMRILALTTPPEFHRIEERISDISREMESAISAQNFERAAKLRDEETRLNAEYEIMKENRNARSDSDVLTVTDVNIADVVTLWTTIPVSRLMEEENERLLHLDDLLREKVIGQDEAVEATARAIRRGRLGLKDPRRPIGSLIFLGQSGVGKTELAKSLAEILFGSRSSIIRLDMSEYMEKHSISKLIGSPPGYVGYDEGGQLTEKIRRKPYSVVLFDEIEKAHPDIFNALLQVLDDGILTDSQGRHIDFSNTVIIMTSNIGASTKSTSLLGFASSAESERAENAASRERILSALRRTFRPEFLNRVDDIIVFNSLNRQSIEKISKIMLNDLKKRISPLGIEVDFSDNAVNRIMEKGFDSSNGARPLRRTISRLIEDKLATAILDGSVKAPCRITVDIDGDNTLFIPS